VSAKIVQAFWAHYLRGKPLFAAFEETFYARKKTFSLHRLPSLEINVVIFYFTLLVWTLIMLCEEFLFECKLCRVNNFVMKENKMEIINIISLTPPPPVLWKKDEDFFLRTQFPENSFSNVGEIPRSLSGLPDGLFSNQKSKFG
jgi:hypothetical protein